MELRQLRHFVAVVDCANLSRAAERVAISQPALTRSIKNLEDLLGVELLERKPRGVAPTEAGLALYHHAQIVLNACQRLTREVRELERGVTGTVYVGVGSMFATHVTATVAQDLAQAHPRLAMVVTDGFFEELLRRIQDGRLDLIFSNFPQVTVSADFVLEPLMTVRSVVMAGRSHPLAKRRSVERSDLVAYRWVIADQPHAQDSFERYFAEEGLPAPRDVFRTNSLNLMMSLVRGGKFLCPLPAHLLTGPVPEPELLPLPLDSAIERQAGLIYRSGADSRPAVGHVLDEFRRVARSA
ncbi:MAG: LysR family transcriptional regulator [Gammaproteobacteria bacterium]|nr:LysR family transcriptional regulator [Gammaproteobacteria bacterium]